MARLSQSFSVLLFALLAAPVFLAFLSGDVTANAAPVVKYIF